VSAYFTQLSIATLLIPTSIFSPRQKAWGVF
jgi:hypothetical protein